MTSADSLRHLFELMANDGLDVEEARQTLDALEKELWKAIFAKGGDNGRTTYQVGSLFIHLKELLKKMPADNSHVMEAIKTLPLLQLVIERQLRFKTGRKP